MAKKEDFYEELDKKAKHSFCSCQTLVIGFLILAFIFAGLIYVGVKKVTTAVKPTRAVTANQATATELRDKLEKLAIAPGASTNVTITEQELTSILIEAINNNPQVPLRQLQAQINPEAIILNATATSFANTDLTINVLPKVASGVPTLELVKIQAGTLAVPTVLTEKIDEMLQSALTKQLSNLQGVTIKSIQLDTGRLTISGVINNSN